MNDTQIDDYIEQVVKVLTDEYFIKGLDQLFYDIEDDDPDAFHFSTVCRQQATTAKYGSGHALMLAFKILYGDKWDKKLYLYTEYFITHACDSLKIDLQIFRGEFLDDMRERKFVDAMCKLRGFFRKVYEDDIEDKVSSLNDNRPIELSDTLRNITKSLAGY